jgi:Fe-S cluster biogenesis protein NfuA
MGTDTAPVTTADATAYTTAYTAVATSPVEPALEAAAGGAEELDPRALTLANVERALDELRPYLMADGGNVEVVEIDGPIVKVRLQGACGSCPSSTMTLKMGIERKLREAIPEVDEVVQVL